MSFGFTITRLTLSGPGVPDAELHLTKGLNVIAGPSDTGKTFIAECIDFAMGSSTPPKEIPQAARYESIRMDLASQGDEVFALERSLRGGDIRLHADDGNRVLRAKHQADNDETVSSFLLGLSGLSGHRVRTNQQGKTRPMSFRDIARLILIDEETVISASSPVVSGQYTTKTAETGVFRLLLTGVDDSSVIAKEDPQVAQRRQEGRVDVLELLLRRGRDQLSESDDVPHLAELRDQLSRLDAVVEMASAELGAEQESVAAIETRRREAWTRLRQSESRGDVLSELQKRFELLQAQYASDLRRLDAIAEAGIRLGQMQEERCPVCGALAEHHDREHHEQAAPADVAQSCRAEGAKIATLLNDLQVTLTENAAHIQLLNAERSAGQAELDQTSDALKTMLQPRLQAAVQKVRDAQARRDAVRRRVEVVERVAELESLLLESTTPIKKERAVGPSSTVSSGQAEEFSKEVEALLRTWHFPNLDRVTFSEDDQDVVISGRPRGSHGKGVRAITRAAFHLALLRFCARTEKPFPGLVLIDSPLVVYREPDSDEGGFPLDVKEAFYRSVAEEFKDVQVIILENDEPPAAVRPSLNFIQFTGAETGRRGFIPR